MPRCIRLRTVYTTVIVVVLLFTVWIYLPNFKPQEYFDDRGIVARQGLGLAGAAYPTKPPGVAYPTLVAGKLRAAGFVLKVDDDPVPRRRNSWFEDEGKQIKRSNDTDKKEKKKEDIKEVITKKPYQQQVEDAPPLYTIMPKLPGTNVISMTLYGSSLRYTIGAIHNAELARANFPGWTLRIYTETPSTNPRYGLVPDTVIARLRALGADIHFIDPGEDFVPPMMWRFLVADDMWVDRFIVRDCDARLIERDAAAVYDWIKTGKPFHCIRDHPSHAAYAVSGGMWGGKPSQLQDALRRSWREMMRGVRKDYLEDMNFLNYVIWPNIQAHAFCSDSVSCDKYVNSFPFPIPRYGYEHVGQVYNEHDLGRPMDIDILRQAGENPICLPGKNVTHQLL